MRPIQVVSIFTLVDRLYAVYLDPWLPVLDPAVSVALDRGHLRFLSPRRSGLSKKCTSFLCLYSRRRGRQYVADGVLAHTIRR